MRDVSTRFLAAVRESHLIACEAQVYFPGETTPVVLPITDGEVTIDRTAQVRRTGSIRIPWSLDDANDLGVDVRTLALGGYVRLKRGIRYGADDVELVTLGYLRVESVTWGTNDQEAQLELADRMAQVRDEVLREPYSAGGKRPAVAAKELVQAVFGSTITYDTRYDPAITLTDVVFSGSRLDALAELAKAAGGQTYFDADGVWIFDIAAATKQVELTGVVGDDTLDITGLASTAELQVGMTVTGFCVPPGRVIASILSSTSVRLNAPTNTLGFKDATTKNGDPWLTLISDTDDLTVGMIVHPNGTGRIVQVIPGAVKLDIPPSGWPSGTVRSTHGFYGKYPIGDGLVTTELTFAGPGSTYPVFTVDAGEVGILVGANEALDRSRSYNGVLVKGQNSVTTAQFWVLVVDSDVDSPTYWGGPFGKVARVEDTNSVQSSAQATVMANALLNEGLSLSRSLTLEAAPNPALDAGDVIRVVFPDERDEEHVVDAVRIPLGTGPIVLQTRAVTGPRPPAPEPIVVVRDGQVTDESTDITGLSTTSDLLVGMTVTGFCIPTGRSIASILGPTSVRLNAVGQTYVYVDNCGLTSGSPWVTVPGGTENLTVGMWVEGTGATFPCKIVQKTATQIRCDKNSSSTATEPCTFYGKVPIGDAKVTSTLTFTEAGPSLVRRRRWVPFPPRRTRVLHGDAVWRELRGEPVAQRIREPVT